ncbi:putative Tyrosyl-DNA phosphodiesterase 1 [Blattamonas nauphoetae]|uniref:Tyrosyl-DNA phosphodiesterase 1 n=1 Tax=Blattamonas nauphoetae TaxID=2049346 RepID=A0ABQ9XLP4_9EUKA|nr:putative Tyrosyl-DNA phosphodiesterase 1 [Blattamonas nauphoetae]
MNQLEQDALATFIQQLSAATFLQSKAEIKQIQQPLPPPTTFSLLTSPAVSAEYRLDGITFSHLFDNTLQSAILTTYVGETKWILNEAPRLSEIPVSFLYGKNGWYDESTQKDNLPPQFKTFFIDTKIPFGLHHSKIMLLTYPTGLRFVVTTANLIESDWNGRTQALWMQDFPLLPPNSHPPPTLSLFQTTLRRYLATVGITQSKINLDLYDFSGACAELLCSVPGSFTLFENDPRLGEDWGHFQLRKLLLHHHDSIPQIERASLEEFVFQFSSFGTLTEVWLDEFCTSLGFVPQTKSRLGEGSRARKLSLIWPTVNSVRRSFFGYDSGGSLCLSKKAVRDFWKEHLCDWDAEVSGRQHLMPHCKFYLPHRLCGDEEDVEWIVMTSANLSKSAWGFKTKEGKHHISNYECGVLLHPHRIEETLADLRRKGHTSFFNCTGPPHPFPETDRCVFRSRYAPASPQIPPTQPTQGVSSPGSTTPQISNPSSSVIGAHSSQILLPIPFSLPPLPYPNPSPTSHPDTSELWVWDTNHRTADIYGNCWIPDDSERSAPPPDPKTSGARKTWKNKETNWKGKRGNSTRFQKNT